MPLARALLNTARLVDADVRAYDLILSIEDPLASMDGEQFRS
jgi:hypothetical protein